MIDTLGTLADALNHPHMRPDRLITKDEVHRLALFAQFTELCRLLGRAHAKTDMKLHGKGDFFAVGGNKLDERLFSDDLMRGKTCLCGALVVAERAHLVRCHRKYDVAE